MKRAKRFVQFYEMSTGYVNGTIPPTFKESAKTPIPACGSDSVAFLDGRLNARNYAREARELCKKRKFIGFTVEQGDFLNPYVVRKLELV